MNARSMNDNIFKLITTFGFVIGLFAAVFIAGNLILSGSIFSKNIVAENHVVVPEEILANADKPVTKPTVAAILKSADPTAHGSNTAQTDLLPTPAAIFDLATFTADLKRGKKVANKCKACHTFAEGKPNRTGPNLWQIYGRQSASVEGFKYSDAMKAFSRVWSKEELFAYLESPKTYMPGNKMAFAGIKSPEDRAHLIGWLETLK